MSSGDELGAHLHSLEGKTHQTIKFSLGEHISTT